MNVVAFTGYRPEKMPFVENKKDEAYMHFREQQKRVINRLVERGYTDFISGVAMGFDTWVAEDVLELRKTNKELHLISALPHSNFESRRSMAEKMRFNKILKKADLVKEINNHYFTGCYQVRNEWMVDRSNLVIAVFNGQKSGTKNTVDYAKRKGIKIVNVLDGI